MAFFINRMKPITKRPDSTSYWSSMDNASSFLPKPNITDHHPDVLRFSYSTSANIRWMQNFWLCQNDSNFHTCSGYIASLANFMADALNMSISLELASADGLGSMLPNGTWSPGVTRDVIDGKADFSLGLWDSGRCRSTVCLDYMFETSFSVLVPLPKPKQMFTAFVEPFAASTWITLLVAIIVMGLFLTTFKDKHYPDFTWFGLFATVIGQDYSENMAKGYSRKGRKWSFMPMGAWMVAMTFLYICYTTTVIDYFLVQVERRIDSLEELVKLDYNSTVNPALVSFFQAITNSRSPTLREMRSRVTSLVNQTADYYPMSDEAYIDDETVMFLRLDGLRASGDERWRQSYAFTEQNLLAPRYRTAFFSPLFPRLRDASKASRKFVEYGFSVYNERAFLTESYLRMIDNLKGVNERQVLMPIPLNCVYAWFVGLLVGEAVAFVAFLGELLWVRFSRVEWEHFGQFDD